MSVTTNNSVGEVQSASRGARVSSRVEVGVVGIAATRTGPCAAWRAMDDYATLIADRTPLRPVRLPLPSGDVRTVSDRIIGVSSTASVLFVVGLGPSESAAVQRRVADYGGPLVITELDVVTVALAAAATAALRSQVAVPRRGGIVVTDIESAPQLGPILFAVSGRSVTGWHERDASAYPLRLAVTRDDVLIDLAGTATPSIAPRRTVTLPTALFDYGALVLPGLLSALCRSGKAVLTLDILASCARAVALLTSPDGVLPDLSHRLLIPAVARRVSKTLSERHPPGSRPQR